MMLPACHDIGTKRVYQKVEQAVSSMDKMENTKSSVVWKDYM